MPPLDAPDDWNAERQLEADRRLDMELEHTFPASDPIPWIHDVGQQRRWSVSTTFAATDGGKQ